MWSSRLFWKLFLVYAGLNLTLALVFLVVLSSWQKSQVLDQVERRLHNAAVVLRSHVRSQLGQDQRAELQQVVKQLSKETGARITLVDHQGVVLADSEKDPSDMENHADRPELKQAASDGLGKSQRRSPTLGIPMYYLALPIEPDTSSTAFVRLALPLQSIHDQVASLRGFLWLLALGVGVMAAGLTYAMVGRIVRPIAELTRGAQAIAEGDYSQQISLEEGDEVGTLETAFSQMQQQLQQRENLLRNNNEQLETVLGSMAEGVLAVDADQSVLLANDASREMLEFTMPDAIGRPLWEVVRLRAVQEAVEKVLEQNTAVWVEFQSTGTTARDLSLRATRLPGDPCPGAVVVLHDVTELKRLENLRSEFVANVSHELKTPLAAVKAYSETLRLGAINDPENNLEFVKRIEEQAERLHELILDMLHLARVEAGKEAFDITDVSVATIVEYCARIHEEDALAKQITLTVQSPDQPVHARVDEEGFSTILDNLISNAIKYTPEKGEVLIRWHGTDEWVMLEVQDTGIGIAPKDQQRVFERFYRVDKARSRELGGTGLGLSIVKHLTQAFGGEVGLTSSLENGSTFQVAVPRSPQAVIEQESTASSN